MFNTWKQKHPSETDKKHLEPTYRITTFSSLWGFLPSVSSSAAENHAQLGCGQVIDLALYEQFHCVDRFVIICLYCNVWYYQFISI